MKLETKKGVTADEWRHLTRWREQVFPSEGHAKEWSSPSWHVIAYARDKNPVGHIGFDGFTILVDSVEQLIIGVGGVVVRPEYQGQGIPALLFRQLHEKAVRQIDTETFALFCPDRLVSYYERHGYRLHHGEVRFLQWGEEVTSIFKFMHRGNIAPECSVELTTAPW